MKQCTALESLGVSSKKSNKFSSSPKVADSRTWVKTKKSFFTSTDQSRRNVATSGFLNSTPSRDSNAQFAPLSTDVNNCQRVASPPREGPTKHSDAGMNQDSRQPGCLLCRKNHIICHCPAFNSKSAKECYNVVKSHKVCISCLSTSHICIHCPSSNRCKKCQQKHHSKLHFGFIEVPKPQASTSSDTFAGLAS
ncbi:hypothetical protein HHI36_015285, partial [Cryptolaemus montrouzieri]